MESNPEVVPEDMTLGQFSDFITQAKNTSFPLVDKEGNLTGVITMQDFLGVVFDPDLKDLVVVKELASANVITTTEGGGPGYVYAQARLSRLQAAPGSRLLQRQKTSRHHFPP